MGKVLEMITSPKLCLPSCFLLLVALASGCSAVPLAKAAISRVGGAAAPAVVSPAKGSDQISMTLVSRSIKFPLSRLATKGDVTLWAAADGAQVALRNGFLISTRGFGMDLMAADVPPVSDLTDATAAHSRQNTYLDGADTALNRVYSCISTPVANRSGPKTTYQMMETCESQAGRIKNEFWIDSNMTIVRSKQWISAGVGYAIFDTAEG